MYFTLVLYDIDALGELVDAELSCFAFIIGEITFYFLSFINILIGLCLIKIENEYIFSTMDIFRLFIGFIWCGIGMGGCWSNEMERKSVIYPETLGKLQKIAISMIWLRSTFYLVLFLTCCCCRSVYFYPKFDP